MKENELPEEGNTGVEKLRLYGTYDQVLETCNELECEIEAAIVAIRKKNQENAALVAALKELIPIAEDALFLYLRFGEENHTSARYKSAIERAKLLRDGQQDKD